MAERAELVLRRVTGNPRASLNSFQRRAIEAIEKEDGNFLVVGPTGVGKSIIGYATIIKHGRGFYLAPLRSLMAEKYKELRKAFPDAKIVITNKDYSLPRRRLKDADIRVLSPYKFLIYLDYLDPDDGVVVVDEIHNISKDPEMEVAISSMKAMGFKIVGLSATIHDSDIPRMGRWLDARVIKASEKRPVPLKFTEVRLQLGPGYVVVEKGGGHLLPGEKYVSKEHAVVDLVLRIYEKDPSGGILVRAPTRREADKYAEMIAMRLTRKFPGLGKRVVTSSDHDGVLRRTIEKGVLIHHGGLSASNRTLVEELFRKRVANIVASCYTLSHGVNLPVRYLVITSLFDFNSKPLDPSTFHQISGRAGRPGLDDFGEVVVVTVGDLESYLLTKLMSEKATRVRSKIYNPWTLTKLAAQRLFFDKAVDGFLGFLRNTYYAQEYGPKGLRELEKLAEEALGTVADAYFDVDPDGKIYPRGRNEAIAASMGLHPKEWRLHAPLAKGDYREALSLLVDAAMEATGIRDRDVMNTVMDYGFLAIYLGSWKAREVAEMCQTILDAVGVYVRRTCGWSSEEFKNAKSVIEMFMYGGNPDATHLAAVLRYDEMKRVIRNLPVLLFTEGATETTALEYVRAVVRLVFGFKKFIYMKRVRAVVEAVLKVLYGDAVPENLPKKALAEASREVGAIASEMGAKVVG